MKPITSAGLDTVSNGLVHAIETIIMEDLTTVCTLVTGERGREFQTGRVVLLYLDVIPEPLRGMRKDGSFGLKGTQIGKKTLLGWCKS